MKYTSINIQGNLVSEEILQKIEEAEVQGQLPKDFGFEPGINLRNEIEYAWSRVKLDWKHFIDRSEKLPASDPYGTTLSRRWMASFFNTLGFELTLQKASLQGGNQQLYSISHTCDQLDGVPIHIVGFYDPFHPEKNTLDIRSSGGTSRLSPHATIQEYLNVTEYLYAMATNGLILRLVRDSGRLVKMTYIEFDLKRLLEEDKYSEFTLLYRLLHASRFPKSKQETEQCFLEKYYQDSIESGNRIRDGLSNAVKESLIALGNGLLEHPENSDLREKILGSRPDAREFYHQLLRLIYRLLFLMVTEERDLIFSEIQDETKEPDLDDMLKGIKRPTKKQKEIYYNFYSLVRLRKLSQKRYLLESQYSDLWQGLMQAFALFESGGTGRELGIQALGSELFSQNAMPDITSSKVNNRVLLKCIKSLNEFEDDKHNLSFINYRALDVEELGSVYEGLLELEPVFEWENGKPRFTFKKSSERSSSGSHYTPEDLVKPLIQHSLEYLIEDRVNDFYKGKATDTETIKKLLDLKICDVACGSGHILLSAARRIALEVARVETGEQQPNPTSFRNALKEVIKNCIYGVDKNPLAVELCKVALWLESHNPGEPLSFLDHKIKCGDAIVGLANRKELQKGIVNEAYLKLPGDDPKIASTFLKKNKLERILREKSGHAVQLTTETDYKVMEDVKELNRLIDNFSNLLENTPEEIDKKEKAYRLLINSENLKRLKILADVQITPFFLAKTESNKDFLVTDAQYHRYLQGETKMSSNLEVKANELSTSFKFFHWFLEFPEVFKQSGFDCIMGNPPFLGGKKISGNYGDYYLKYLKTTFEPSTGGLDLVTYFFRRIFNLIKKSGFQSLISTKTIYQGDSRIGGLEYILKTGGSINFAIRLMSWPGKAAVEISLISINKEAKNVLKYLNNKPVKEITSRLDDDIDSIQNPQLLQVNQTKSFIGSVINGMGFIINENDKHLFENEVIFPYLSGDDVNNEIDQKASRFIINFKDWDEGYCHVKYPIAFKRIEETVKPQRVLLNRESYKRLWWQYAEKCSDLYRKISELENVFAIPRVSKYINIAIVPSRQVFMDKIVVLAFDNSLYFSLLQNSIFDFWAWKYSSTLGSSTINFRPTEAFQTYPFPSYLNPIVEAKLKNIGEIYYKHRKQLMRAMMFGLTKTYNTFHAKDITKDLTSSQNLASLSKAEIEKKYGKELWNLLNHLNKTAGTCSFDEAVAGIKKLRKLHVEMDGSVLEAYGWLDIDLKHDFYELDNLPENDRVRYTIHPDARKELLKRLLELNHKVHEKEVKSGFYSKKNFGTKKSEKLKSGGVQVNDPEEGYGGLFE